MGKKTFRISDEAQEALSKIQKELDIATENATIDLVLNTFRGMATIETKSAA